MALTPSGSTVTEAMDASGTEMSRSSPATFSYVVKVIDRFVGVAEIVAMTYIVLESDNDVNFENGRCRVALSDLLLHPVRLRIVQTFLGRGELTTAALSEYLSDVPPATLYRQVTALLEAGILEVLDERKVRGAVERTLVLRAANANLGPEESAAMTSEEHRRGFVTFVAGLIGDFDRYLASGDVDLARDRIGYRQYAAHLTDEEMDELIDDLRAVIQPRLEHESSPERTRRLISHVLVPSSDPAFDGPSSTAAS